MMYVALFSLQIGFVLMVGGWFLMLMFLKQRPAPADWPRDPFSRWARFLKGDGFPPEAQSTVKLISWMLRGALALLLVGFVCFFLGGGPDALQVPPPANVTSPAAETAP